MSLDMNGIDDILNYLSNEYSNGNLHDGNKVEYTRWLLDQLNQKKSNQSFVNEMNTLFKNVSNIDDSKNDEIVKMKKSSK